MAEKATTTTTTTTTTPAPVASISTNTPRVLVEMLATHASPTIVLPAGDFAVISRELYEKLLTAETPVVRRLFSTEEVPASRRKFILNNPKPDPEDTLNGVRATPNSLNRMVDDIETGTV